MKNDYLVVGTGLYGAVVAHEVIEKEIWANGKTKSI